MDMDSMDMMMGNCSCNMSMGGMRMQFYFGLMPDKALLFTGWTISTAGEMVGTIIVIIALAIVYEALKSLREYLMARDTRRRKKGKSANINTNAMHDKTHLLSSTVQEPHWMVRIGREYINVYHIVQSALHVVQVGLAYLLMLIAMTYNGYLFLAVCIGAGIGYYIFGACRKQMLSTQSIEDRNDHCT